MIASFSETCLAIFEIHSDWLEGRLANHETALLSGRMQERLREKVHCRV